MLLSDNRSRDQRRVKVLLADDHPVVLAGIKSLVDAEGDFEIVGEAKDGQIAVELAALVGPEIAVIDISMPGLAGKTLAARLKQACPSCKLLTLTVHEDHGYLRQMLEVGVSGYLLKRSAAADLIKAIRVIAAGGLYIDPALSTKSALTAVAGMLVGEVDHSAQLSSREIEVLRLLAAGHSIKATAADLQIAVKTAETYKARAFEKLGIQSRVELIRYALGVGWLER